MAAPFPFLVSRLKFLPSLPCLHRGVRHTHSQSLWEELLGRKIEASAAKKLEEAFLEYRVRKAVPSWLPFLPNSSFWIPSTEETIKNLEILAKRMKGQRPPRKERLNVFKNAPDRSDKGPVSSVAAWFVIHQTDKLLSSANWNAVASADAVFKPSAEKGTIIEVEVEGVDDGNADDNNEEELEIDEKQKPEGA